MWSLLRGLNLRRKRLHSLQQRLTLRNQTRVLHAYPRLVTAHRFDVLRCGEMAVLHYAKLMLVCVLQSL